MPNGRRIVFIPDAGHGVGNRAERTIVYWGPEDKSEEQQPVTSKRRKRRRRGVANAAAAPIATTAAQTSSRATDKGRVSVTAVVRAAPVEVAPRAAAPPVAGAGCGVTHATTPQPRAEPKPPAPVVTELPAADVISEEIKPPEAPGDVPEPEPMHLDEPPRQSMPVTPCSVDGSDGGDLPMPPANALPPPQPLGVEDVGALVLSRKVLVRLRDRLDFGQLVTGCFVRIGLAATGTHAVKRVTEVTCRSKPYALHATRDGRTSYAFQILQLDGDIRIQLSQASNRPAEWGELEAEQQRIAGKPGFTPEEAQARAAAIAAALAALEGDAVRCAQDGIERAVASASHAVASQAAVGEVDPELGIRVDGGMMDCIDQQLLDDLRAKVQVQRQSSSGDVSSSAVAVRHSDVDAQAADHMHSSSGAQPPGHPVDLRPPRWQRRWREDGEAFHHPAANAARRIDVYTAVTLPTPTQLRRQRRAARLAAGAQTRVPYM